MAVTPVTPNTTVGYVRRDDNLPDPESFTLAGWFYLPADFVPEDESFPILFSLEGGGSYTQVYYWQSQDVWRLTIGDGNDGSIIPSPPTGQWFFLALRCTEGIMALRMLPQGANEFTAFQVSRAGTATPSTFRLLSSAANRRTKGAVYRHVLWDGGISDDGLMTVALSGMPVEEESLRWWWPLEDDEDDRDLSGNSRPPTFSGLTDFQSPAIGGGGRG